MGQQFLNHLSLGHLSSGHLSLCHLSSGHLSLGHLSSGDLSLGPVLWSPLLGSLVLWSPVLGSPVLWSPVLWSPVLWSRVLGSPVLGSSQNGGYGKPFTYHARYFHNARLNGTVSALDYGRVFPIYPEVSSEQRCGGNQSSCVSHSETLAIVSGSPVLGDLTWLACAVSSVLGHLS